MIFYFLISIVFIAELIIAAAAIIYFIKLDKACKNYNELLSELRPKINEILSLSRQISEQMPELASDLIDNLKLKFQNLLLGQLKNALAGFTFMMVKREVEKRLSKS